ncbi:DMT family transporter [Thalassococcus sp. BH17M4-6]|uniref:DMT family transporter n=1 Tax=Thalassococcus sp. BH17M4-6 TaxID=3413148 RepID=UPI003BD2E145
MWTALALMFVAMSCIPAGDSAGKLLTSEFGFSPAFVGWARFLLGALVMGMFLPAGSLRLFRDWRIWGRGALLSCGILSILTALSTAPIASVFAAFFIGPIVSYALSALLLREAVTPLRSMMMGLGFLGVLLVVRPGFSTEPGLLFALLAGVFYGAYLTASRALTHLAAPRALLFTQLVAGVVFLAPLALRDLPVIDADSALLLLASGLFSMTGNLLLLMAYRIGTASAIAPMVYFQLIAATVLGWLIFGDLPDALTWAGLAVIIGSGVISARLGRASFRPAAPLTDRG